jgi:C4-dicarboxylate transporter DctM subunit
MTVIFLFVLFIILAGAPLFVVLGGVTLVCFAVYPVLPGGDYLASFEAFTRNFNVLEKMVALADEPTLVAIPFFMVAGGVMSRGLIARRLVDVANAMFGWLPGGLAVSAVVACMFFAAISGSSPVTVITIGSIMFPALVAAGYREQFSLGLITSSGGLGIIIPPSIPMIIFAIFASSAGVRVNIENLFIAGVGPGLLIGAALAGYCVLEGRGMQREKFSFPRLVEALRDGLWSLMLPLFILGGIYLGVFNATQASAISVMLALLIEVGIHRQLKLEDLPGLLHETAVLMGSILVIITLAFGFSEFLTIQNLPVKLQELFESWDLGPVGFILALNGILLIVGALMDIISAIILFVPLIAPLAVELGIDPLHLGLIFIVNLEIGYLTPPLGLNLFVAAGYFRKSFGQVVRAVVPFMLLTFGCLMLVSYVPRISLQLVSMKEGSRVNLDFPSGKKADADGEGGGSSAPPGQKTLEDMMRELDEKKAAEDANKAAPEGEGAPEADKPANEGGEGAAPPKEEPKDEDYDYGL